MSERLSYRAAASFAVVNFASVAVLSLGSSILVGRMYGVDVVGQWALVLAPMQAVWFLSSFRERPSLVRLLATLPPRDPFATGLFVAVFCASFVLTVLVGVLGLLAAVVLFRGPIHQPELVGAAALAMAGYVLIANTCFNLDTMFAAFRAGRALHYVRLHQAVAFVVIAVGFALAGRATVTALVLAGIGSYASALVHRLIAIRPYLRWDVPRGALAAGFRELPAIVRFGLKIMPGGIADGVSNETGTWVLALTGTLGGVGAYNRAYALSRRFYDLNWRLNEILFPTLVERREEGDHHGFDRALVDSLRYAAVGLLLPAAVLGGAAVGVMQLFGPGFDEAAGALAVLCLVPAAATLSNMQRHMLYAVDRPWRSTASAGLRMAVTVGVSVCLTLLVGPIGAALGVLAGYLADLGFLAACTRSHLARPLLHLVGIAHLLAIPAAYAAGFGAAHLTYSALPTVVGLLSALSVGTLAFAGVFLAFGGLHTRDRERLAEVIPILRDRLGRAGGVQHEYPTRRKSGTRPGVDRV